MTGLAVSNNPWMMRKGGVCNISPEEKHVVLGRDHTGRHPQGLYGCGILHILDYESL